MSNALPKTENHSGLALASHAKINLFLRVSGKRPDGYHELKTLMLPIGLADTLTFEPQPQPVVELACSDPSLPLDQSNLVQKAAALLRKLPEFPGKGARIFLQKNIPVGAGLGGGSSNGSTTLVGLNRLWNLKLSNEQLEKLSAELGSDTAFFIQSRPALSRGRGEILLHVPWNHALALFLMNFGFGSSTAWAYRNFELENSAPKLEREEDPWETAQVCKETVKTTDVFQDCMKATVANDLEKTVFKKFPILKIAKEFLQTQPRVAAAMMCGSGSTMMAIIPTLEDGENIRKAAQARFGKSIWTWVGQTLPTA